MEYTLTRPCGDMCPFHINCLRGWLGTDRAEEIAGSLVRSEFPCHKTTEFDDDSDYLPGGKKEKHCGGALIVLEKMEQPSQMMRICERLGIYDRRKLDMSAPVFDDLDAFIEHHSD